MPFNFNGNNITAVNWNGNTVSTINYNGTEVWGSTPPVTVEPFYIENRDASNSITTTVVHGSSAPSISLEYSLDNSTWTAYTLDTAVTVPASGKCYFRNSSDTWNYRLSSSGLDSYSNVFTCSGPFNVGGDLTTLNKKEGGVDNSNNWLMKNCYSCLFYHSTNLVDASKLIIPITTNMREQMFNYMFSGCTSLVSAPELPNCGMELRCYQSMFSGCTSLTKAPSKIYGSYAGSYACQNMFNGCVALKNAPEIMATTLSGNYCFSSMFQGCINLQHLEAHFTAWNDTNNATSQWLSTTTPEIIKLVLPDAIGTDLEQTHDVSHIPTTTALENNATYNMPLTFRVLTLTNSVAQIKLQANGSPNAVELQYSRDGTTWTDYTIGDTLQFATAGNYVQFRAKTTNSLFSAGGSDNYQFVVEEGTFIAMGNIMSLLDSSMQTNTVPNYAFYNLFYGFNGIVTHVRCPATDLGTWCYAGLFRANPHSGNKRAFTEYPATYAAERCYQTMYYDDSYLKYIPSYNATSGGPNCFMRTFQNCTSINMDSYKINLTSVPYRGMYEMFVNAGTIYNFELMATELGDRSLNNLFVNANPQHIKVHFSDWYWDGLYATDNWVNNIITDTSDCIFECPTALGTQATIDRGSAKCPTNWTVVNY